VNRPPSPLNMLLSRHTRRRTFVSLLAGAAAARTLPALAQQSSNKIPVVGVLWHAANAEQEDVYLSVLAKAFNDLGYVDGKNIHLDHRFPAENPDRFQRLARELVDAKPDVIVAVTSRGAVELKKVTRTIPVVMTLVADPLGTGLVESLARPGGNFTGLSLMLVDLSGKRLELLQEAVPNLSRVALLLDPTDPSKQHTIKSNEAAAQALGISLWPVEISMPDDIEPAFAKIAQERADGVVRGIGSMLFPQRGAYGRSSPEASPASNDLHRGGVRHDDQTAAGLLRKLSYRARNFIGIFDAGGDRSNRE
jgi:putative tryptophan/tyrosine transport system substrate-binding protein